MLHVHLLYKRSAVDWCTEVFLYRALPIEKSRTCPEHCETLSKLQVQRLDSFWEEQLSPREHRNKRDSPSTPSQGTSEVTVTASSLASTRGNRSTGPSHWSSVDGSAAKALMGSLLEGERKNSKFTISNVIIVDELVNSKKMILYVWR